MRNLTEAELNKSCWRIGNDGKNHLMLPWEDRAICGESVTKREDKQEFTCYECSCTAEGRYWGMGREESLEEKG